MKEFKIGKYQLFIGITKSLPNIEFGVEYSHTSNCPYSLRFNFFKKTFFIVWQIHDEELERRKAQEDGK